MDTQLVVRLVRLLGWVSQLGGWVVCRVVDTTYTYTYIRLGTHIHLHHLHDSDPRSQIQIQIHSSGTCLPSPFIDSRRLLRGMHVGT